MCSLRVGAMIIISVCAQSSHFCSTGLIVSGECKSIFNGSLLVPSSYSDNTIRDYMLDFNCAC